MSKKSSIKHPSLDGMEKTVLVSANNTATDKSNHLAIEPGFEISKSDSLSTIFMKIREVILSSPPYVEMTQIPWMLSILDELTDLAEKDIWPVEPPVGHRGNHYLDYHCEDRDVIYKIRFYYLLEFIWTHLYGGDLGNFNLGSKIKSFKVSGYLHGAATEDSPYFVRRVGDYLRSKQFNQQMNWWLEGHRIVFKNKAITTSSGKVNDRIFGDFVVGTLGGFINSKAPYGMKAVPASLSKDKANAEHLEFSFSPMLATYIETIENSKVECVRVNVPLDSIICISENPLEQDQRCESSSVSTISTSHSENALAALEVDNKLREQRSEEMGKRAYEIMLRMHDHKF